MAYNAEIFLGTVSFTDAQLFHISLASGCVPHLFGDAHNLELLLCTIKDYSLS